MCFGDEDSDGWSTTSSQVFKKRRRPRVWSPDGYADSPNLPVASLSPAYSTSSLISATAPRRSSLARARRPSSPPPAPRPAVVPQPRRSAPAPNPPPRPRARPPPPPPSPPPPPYPQELQQPAHARASSFPLPLPPPPFAAPFSADPPMRRHSIQSSAPSSPRPQLAHNLPWMSNVDLPSGSAARAGGRGREARRSRARAASTADLRVPVPAAAAGPAARSVANVDRVGMAELAGQEENGNGAQGPSFHERLSARLNDIIDEIDHEVFRGGDLALDPLQQSASPQRTAGPVSAARSLVRPAHGSSVQSGTFSKVWLYANSRLPPYLPPLKVYMPTYPLLCLAAKHSLRVYERPVGSEREDRIRASLFHRTKAMTLKTHPIDDMNLIVFAIRGSSGFIDWAVNFLPAPSPPEGFLDDPGNLCHAGFLSVAKSMIKPVAARLRTLLAENPSRSACSLLITGHSAGGAVAQLLYSHMLSKVVESELSYLVGFFKRVHCVTFGAPPVSLLPLATPKSRLNRKSLFFAFVNEGDPVARADRAIVGSLLKLYASAPPSANPQQPAGPSSGFKWHKPTTWAAEAYALRPTWPPPPATLSLGGRVVLLRPRYDGRGQDDVEACTVTDEMLRDVVFGDPACHTMTMYSKRIEILATRAVTVGGFA